MHRVVIVGGGFGGLYLAKSLKRAPVDVTLIDRRNFHLFQPLLYQVATGGLSPANIAAPLRSVLQRQRNTRVLLGEVIGFDVAARSVRLRDGEVEYDTLVVASGVSHAYFGNDHWERHAPGLKTIEDATEIRSRVLRAFEAAERETQRTKIREWLNFVVVGGGPTGVELAGTLAEIARHTLAGEFRTIDPADATILLVEAADRVLTGYPPHLSERAAASLRRLGVTVRTGTRVSDIRRHVVALQAAERSEEVATRTVLWAAGVQGSSLGRALADATGVELDRAGRVMVESDCNICGGGQRYPEIFVIGDLAHFAGSDGAPLPGVAPVAMQQGRFVADVIQKRIRLGTTDLHDDPFASRFVYRDKGSMATIGRAAAVAQVGPLSLSGYLAWLMWLFVHILFLIEFQNRVLVMMQWAWSYFTWNRSARLITGAADTRDP
jgi:NADH dehydrogenase